MFSPFVYLCLVYLLACLFVKLLNSYELGAEFGGQLC